MKAGRIKRDPAEYTALLHEQVDLLRSYFERFDAGAEHFAKPMATALRVILFDKDKRATSLLTHLGRKGIEYLDTSAPWSPNIIAGWTGLLGGEMSIVDGKPVQRYLPLCRIPGAAPGTWRSWDDWSRPVVLSRIDTVPEVALRAQMSRWDLILAVAETDGGAHVDAGRTEQHHIVATEPGLGFRTVQIGGPNHGTEYPMTSRPDLVSIRQIAHEVVSSLERAGLATTAAAK